MFVRKQPFNTLKFCQNAVELPNGLMESEKLTLALSHVTRTAYPIGKRGTALGVVHDIHGLGCPLLPVEVEFGPSFDKLLEVCGEICPPRDIGEFYRLHIVIESHENHIFESLLNVFEHSALSQNSFVHIELERTNGVESDLMGHKFKEKYEAHKTLMQQVDDGQANLSNLSYDQAIIRDGITLSGSAWSRLWFDIPSHRPILHDHQTAKYRKAMGWPRQSVRFPPSSPRQ